MILRVYGVFDTKAEVYGRPFFTRMRGEAIRAWSDALVDGQSEYAKHPGDYNLFELGEFDQGSGLLVPGKDGPVLLGNGLSFLKKESSREAAIAIVS